MQAIILAAGRGKRMGELTKTLPKPLLQINSRPIIEYTLLNLPREIDEVILVIGYQGHKIRNYFGKDFWGRKLRYVWQLRLDGTAGALWQLQSIIRDKFLVLNGDDIYHHDDLKKLIKHDWAILAQETQEQPDFGALEINEHGFLVKITAEETGFQDRLVSTGGYVLDSRLFDYSPESISTTEYGLPQTLANLAGEQKIKVEKAKFWRGHNCAADLEKSRAELEKHFGHFKLIKSKKYL